MIGKPLYCFKLIETNPDQIILKKYIIPEWSLRTVGNWRKEYRFSGAYIHSSHKTELVSASAIDKLCYNRFYTFDPDLAKVEAIVEKHLDESLLEAKEKVDRALRRLDKWRARRIEE